MTRAIVTLIMKGNRYVDGAIGMAISCRKNGWNEDLVCMITPDVTETDQLTKIFNRVVKVPLLQKNVKDMTSFKQRTLYASWMDISFTKWNCLKLKYSKVLFIDADIILFKNPSEIFNLQAPAAWFGSVSAAKAGLYYAFSDSKNGEEINSQELEKAINGQLKYKTFILSGAMVLVEPDKILYQSYIDWLDKESEPFGYSNFSSCDEQAIALFLHLQKKKWTQMDKNWQVIPWHADWMALNGEANQAYGWHYFGSEKPWEKISDRWGDVKVWRDIFEERSDFFLKKSSNKIVKGIKIATFNIFNCRKKTIQEINQYLIEFDLDFVVIQEICKKSGKILGDLWPYFVQSGENMVVSKHPIQNIKKISLNVGNNTYYRTAIMATILDHTFITTHLDHMQESRRMEQLNKLKEYFPLCDLLLGDLNSITYMDYSVDELNIIKQSRQKASIELISEQITKELTKYFEIKPSTRTTPYNTRVDYILCRKGLASKCQIDNSIEKNISDHNLVICFI